MRGKMKILVLTLLLLPLFASMAIFSASSAVGGSIVTVAPLIFDTTMIPGTQFTLNINVDYVYKLWGYQFTMSWDPDVLHGVSFENGPFLESNRGHAVVVPPPNGGTFDNVAGTLSLGGACLDPVRRFPTGGSDEFGALGHVTFEVVGYGSTYITLGSETGLADPIGRWIVHKEENPECFFDGYFNNVCPGPELWIREKHGTHGGGAFPEWHVGLAGDYQTLYSKVANSGDGSAEIKVKFTVEWLEGAETAEYWSNEAAIPGVYIDPETGRKVFPVITVATDPFQPGPEGLYTVTAALYFKACDMEEYMPYELAESSLGGLGTGRDTSTKFKVAEQM